MTKVLLIFEDYIELNTSQFTLKKVGFDCLGISTEFGTSEKVISFNPDIVIASGKGTKVSTIGVGRRLKDMPRWTGKTVLIFPAGSKPKPEELMKIRMDVVLEAPVENVRLIQVLAKLTNQDDQILIEKLIKSMAQENTSKDPSFVVGSKPTSDKVYVGGGSGSDTIKNENAIVGSGAGSADRKSGDELIRSGQGNKDSDLIKVPGFEISNSQPEMKNEPKIPTSSTAFEELNRREQAKASRRQFSLTPEAKPEEGSETRFGNLEEKGRSQLSRDEDLHKMKAELELKGTDATPFESRKVDSLENKEKTVSSVNKKKSADSVEPSRPPAGAVNSQFPIDSSTSTSLQPATTQAHIGAGATPESSIGSVNFEDQVRKAADSLPLKMKTYKEMTHSLTLPRESTIKKTKSRKVQIELMKDIKQVELEKQDGLRREFTKALFKKK